MTFTNLHGDALLGLLFQNLDGAGADTDTAYTFVGSGLLKAVTPGSLYVSLHTADPGVTGTQLTSEANYGQYARIAVTRAAGAGGWTLTAGSGANASKIENTSAITWLAKNDAGTQTIVWAGIGTSSTGAGNLLFRCPLALETPKPFEVTDLTNDDIVVYDHGYSAGDQIVFMDVEGAALPVATAFAEGAAHYVISTGLVANVSFRASDSSGGSAFNFTARGSGLVAKVVPKIISQNDVAEIAAGKLVVLLR